jgi:hypothetical protein
VLVLVAFLLVVLATGLRVAGVIVDNTALLYASVGCAAAAAGTLALAVWLAKRNNGDAP